jgi:lipopolysaccharide/colanic/teichoic acid biosynthesis glycosyltransferase
VIKRLFDFLASAAALVVLSPLLLLLGAAIVVDSGWPALFRQARVGRGGAIFRILKFRTMVPGADTMGRLTVGRDSRVTRVGGFLRRTKLDELPQLLNVFLGQMSLVGPRPEVPEYVDYYSPEDRDCIFSVRPGITDNASIKFRNESDLLVDAEDPENYYIEQILPAKLALYREYVEGRSFGNDIRIILQTIRTIW